MASPDCAGLLPIPCCSGQLGSVAHLCPARLSVVAERSGPPQPTRPGAMGSSHPFVEPLDSTPPRSAPLPHGPLCRSASLVRAVCVKALVRICAGGDQQWSSLPRQLAPTGPRGSARLRVSLTAYALANMHSCARVVGPGPPYGGHLHTANSPFDWPLSVVHIPQSPFIRHHDPCKPSRCSE
jgi:hypothetical protein